MNIIKRRRLKRKRILNVYKEYYCRPFYVAVKHNSNRIEELNQRMHAFTLGVCVADPHGRWYKTFNKACDEVMREMLG